MARDFIPEKVITPPRPTTSAARFHATTCSLFTHLPRRDLLGNPLVYTRIPIRYRGVGKRACSASFLVEVFSETRFLRLGAHEVHVSMIPFPVSTQYTPGVIPFGREAVRLFLSRGPTPPQR